MPVLGGSGSHSHTEADVTGLTADLAAVAADAATVAAALDQALTARQMFGERLGAAISPATISPTVGAELWTLANLDARGQVSTVSPSITADGTNKTTDTFISLGNMGNGDTTYRIEFDYTNTVPSGWAGITLSLTDSSQVLITGTYEQPVSGVSSPAGTKQGRLTFDFRPPSAGGTYLRLRLKSQSSAPSGTIGVSNVTFKATGDVSLPLLVAETHLDSSSVMTFFQQYDVKSRSRKIAMQEWKTDGVLGFAYHQGNAYVTDKVFGTGPALLDSTFGAPGGSETAGPGTPFLQSVATYSMHSNNNDQIMEVNTTGSTYELRCNTHGGEYLRAAGVTWRIDKGSGFGAWTKQPGLTPGRRFQIVQPTYVCKSTVTQNEANAFANVDHTYTIFPDGVIRCDRTTTFLQTVTLRAFFEWMSSHSTAYGYVGRLGRGQLLHGEIDTRAKLAVPGAPTVTPSSSGGVLAAGTYSYRLAAISPQGETTVGTAATGTTTGSTGSNALTWSAVAGATGYAIYGRTASSTGGAVNERLLARTTQLAWTDDGTSAPTTAPPARNTAAAYTGAIGQEAIHTTDATWAAFFDPQSGWAFGNIYDRESPLARTGVAAIRSRLEGATGNIQKNYANLTWTGGDTISVTAGTVWTATHYSYVWLPTDADRFHDEIAARAASLSALSTLYPSA